MDQVFNHSAITPEQGHNGTTAQRHNGTMAQWHQLKERMDFTMNEKWFLELAQEHRALERAVAALENGINKLVFNALSDNETAAPLTSADRETITKATQNFATLLRAHLKKTESTLYPIAERGLSQDEQKCIHDQFREFDKTHPTEIQRLKIQSDILSARFLASNSSELECSETGCEGCQNHFCKQRWPE